MASGRAAGYDHSMLPTLLSLLAWPTPDVHLHRVIDAEVRAAWKTNDVRPAARADDDAFLRRVWLDLAGALPTADEARAFLDDKDEGKRTKLIDRLLDDPRFARHQADVWDLALFGRNPPNGEATRKRDGFKAWLTDQWAKRVPYDRWARELLRAEQPGSELFLVQFRNHPEEATNAVSRLFLGTQLQCARCHDHPCALWTQKDFYGVTGFFVRLVVQDTGAKEGPRYRIGEKTTGEVLFTGAARDQKPGQKGDPVKPRFLKGAVLDEPPPPAGFKEPVVKDGGPPLPRPAFSRKEKFADWVVASDNRYFAKAAVNRVWAQFLGRGLVEPIDDLRDDAEASHPALFDALTRGFVAHKFDLRWLIRELVTSETYQLAATGPLTKATPEWFARARVRPLSAEELIAAVRTATGFDADDKAPARLPGSGDEYFLRYFGEPTDGQGDFQGGLVEHLFLNNGDVLRSLIRRKPGNLADGLLSSTEPWEARVDRLYLAILSRRASPAERAKFVAFLTSGPDKPEARVEDAIWVLFNTAEFRFNH